MRRSSVWNLILVAILLIIAGCFWFWSWKTTGDVNALIKSWFASPAPH